MLFKFSQFANSGNKLHKPQRAEVIDNMDPKKLGRVKVQIPGLIEGDKEKLPWVYPRNPSAFGGNNKSASLHVPRIGSFLEVHFPYGNPYHSFYVGYWHHENNYDMSAFQENYPNRYGFQDPTGKQFIVDMKTHDMIYNHTATDDDQNTDAPDTSGEEGTGSSNFNAARKLGDSSSQNKLTLHLNKDGSINLNSLKDMLLQMAGDTNLSTSGSTNVSSQNGKLTLQSVLSDVLHKAGGSIQQKAVETIVNKASKIFLN